jgi:hypothetical protein
MARASTLFMLGGVLLLAAATVDAAAAHPLAGRQLRQLMQQGSKYDQCNQASNDGAFASAFTCIFAFSLQPSMHISLLLCMPAVLMPSLSIAGIIPDKNCHACTCG